MSSVTNEERAQLNEDIAEIVRLYEDMETLLAGNTTASTEAPSQTNQTNEESQNATSENATEEFGVEQESQEELQEAA